MKALVATQKPFAAKAVEGIKAIFKAAGIETVMLEKYVSEAELIESAAKVDALIVRSDKVTKAVLDAAKNLKIVVRAGAGYDNLDLEACTAHNVVAMNTPGQNANAVAELAIAFMIYMSRNRFTPGTGSEISGKRLGLQAFGNVARLVGAKAAALGMKVMAYDPFVKPEDMEAAGVEVAESLEQLYGSSDFVSLHIPATPQTVGSVGASLVSLMPKGACLVNTARKEVIDEASLLALLSGVRDDLKYVADVAPDAAADFEQALGKRYFATPKKMGAETAEANVNAGLAAANQIVAYLKEGCERFRLNR